jgi:hypothetical protein
MADGAYCDDSSIADDTSLWRRIPPGWWVPDENLGRLRPTSAAFDDHRNGTPMSVLIEDVVLSTGRGPDDILAPFKGYAMASIRAGVARECSLGVMREPLPEEPAHAVVFGKKSKGVRAKLATNCEWVVEPPHS